MFCNKCGKEIEDGLVCDECLERERAEELKASEPAVEQEFPALDETLWKEAVYTESVPSDENTNGMLGFGKALASTIMAVIGYIFAIVAYIFAVGGGTITETDPEVALAMLIAAFVLHLVFAIPLAIIALVMGVKSIKLFMNTKGKKPIVTLILGIVGTYHAASALLMFLTSLAFL